MSFILFLLHSNFQTLDTYTIFYIFLLTVIVEAISDDIFLVEAILLSGILTTTRGSTIPTVREATGVLRLFLLSEIE